MHNIILKMTLAVVELPQMPLLLLKLHARKGCVGASATAAAVLHRVPDDAICCWGLLHLIPVFISLCSKTIYLNEALWQCCCMYSLDLPAILCSTQAMLPRKLRACAEPTRAAARRGEAPLVYYIKNQCLSYLLPIWLSEATMLFPSIAIVFSQLSNVTKFSM